jgi:hypothetical protein
MTLDPWPDDPFPEYEIEPGRDVLRHLKRPAAPECASRTPCSAALRRQPVFDLRAHFYHSAPMETHAFRFRLQANAPEGQNRFPIRRPLRRVAYPEVSAEVFPDRKVRAAWKAVLHRCTGVREEGL